jgi:hypothetical protein
LFLFYHYAEQFFEDQMKGESEQSLAERYLGIVMQSNCSKAKYLLGENPPVSVDEGLKTAAGIKRTEGSKLLVL